MKNTILLSLIVFLIFSKSYSQSVTILSGATAGGNIISNSGVNPALNMFSTGVSNPDKMIIQHSPLLTNYGLQYQDGSDKFRFLGNGSTVATFDLENKLVGIGTNNPTAKLHILHSSSGGQLTPTNPHFKLTNSGDLFPIRTVYENNDGSRSFNQDVKLSSASASQNRIQFEYGSTPITTFYGDGKMGVGLSSGMMPSAKLHLLYNSSVGDPQLLLDEVSTNGGARLTFKNNNLNYFSIYGQPTSANDDATMNFYYSALSTENIMTLKGNGKVGINTTSPTAKLDIVHGGDDSNPHINLKATAGESRINWTTNANANKWTLQSNIDNALSADNSIRFEYNEDPKLYIKGSGDVGIGTSTPNAKLEIEHGGSDTDPHIQIKATGEESRINWVTTANSNKWTLQSNIDNSDAADNFIRFEYNTDTKFFIRANGNVGIGTGSPNNKLDVAGTIRAEEVIVDTGWADYVFEESFKLKPLSEVELFIKENKHLPDIPSAKTIQEKGGHVAELMTKMMQKIEELMLYSIQQEKKIEELSKLISKK